MVRDATRRAKMNDGRRQWVDEHREPFGKTRLVAVWGAAWRGVWAGIWIQVSTNAGTVGQNWFQKWDQVCRTNLGANEQHTSVLIRKKKPHPSHVRLLEIWMKPRERTVQPAEEIISEIALQTEILGLIKAHGENVRYKQLRLTESIFWQVQLAMARSWKTVVSINPTSQRVLMAYS